MKNKSKDRSKEFIVRETEILRGITEKAELFSKSVVKGIGDDCAVLDCSNEYYQLAKSSTLSEGFHFNLKWSTPQQIGMKAIESAVSDIAAMGGLPRYALISIAFPSFAKNAINDKFINEIYKGINSAAKKYRISIIGGDLTSSEKIIINTSIIGLAEKGFLALRCNAKIGDAVFCSGSLGKSKAGLELLLRGMKGASIISHLEPKARLNLSRNLAKAGVNSMIDVSDGAAFEIEKICSSSNVRAVIYASNLPVSKSTKKDAERMGEDYIDFSLYGGEDFELMFTAGKNLLPKIKKYDVTAIGKIVERKHGADVVEIVY